MKSSLAFSALLLAAGCQTQVAPSQAPRQHRVEVPAADAANFRLQRLDPALDELIDPQAQVEILAKGYTWSEGPAWSKASSQVVFSDVPRNIAYQWNEKTGAGEFLKPSGYSGTESRGGEPGSNGLTFDRQGRLVLCEHGDRRVARLEKDGSKTTLASAYKGKRFNSPNDLVYKSNGDLYFTDPPYGLEKGNTDPKKELPFNGVYRIQPKGEVTLLTSEITFPNGIAFSPDEKTLYVAVSDGKAPVIMAYPVKRDGTLEAGRVFFDAKPLVPQGKGMPDGLKVDRKGNLFATGPGGVLIINPQGKHLGTLLTGQPTGNCTWGEDGSVLYVTANMYLCRIQTKTKGNRF